MNSYFQKLKSAKKQRNQVEIPPLRGVIMVVGAFIFFVVVLALLIAPKADIDVQFRNESGIINVMSSIFLSIACGLAGVAFYFTDMDDKTKKIFWLLILLAFLFLSLDELMEGHEKLGKRMMGWWGASETFRNWNDVIVLLYGIGAIIFFVLFLPTILKYPRLIEVLSIAFIFYLIHTGTDSLNIDRRKRYIILEETCKIFSSGFFSLAMFTGMLGSITKSKWMNKKIMD